MRPVTNIKDLKQGERIVTLTKGEPQVCELKKGRTQMGFRKIKVTDPACDKYETEE